MRKRNKPTQSWIQRSKYEIENEEQLIEERIEQLQKIRKSKQNVMKVDKLFEAIEPMVNQIDATEETALLMMGCDSENTCGCIKGKGKAIVAMLVEQMFKEKDIEMLIMAAAETFVDVLVAKKDEKDKQQKLS